jgi:hypothetical protein
VGRCPPRQKTRSAAEAALRNHSFPPFRCTEEIGGKQVRSVYISYADRFDIVEIEFLDGTSLSIELFPRVELRVELTDWNAEDGKLLKAMATHANPVTEKLAIRKMGHHRWSSFPTLKIRLNSRRAEYWNTGICRYSSPQPRYLSMITFTTTRFKRSASRIGGFTTTTCMVCQHALASALDPLILDVIERVHVCRRPRAEEHSARLAELIF